MTYTLHRTISIVHTSPLSQICFLIGTCTLPRTCSIVYTSPLHQIYFLMGMCTLGHTSSNSYKPSTPNQFSNRYPNSKLYRFYSSYNFSTSPLHQIGFLIGTCTLRRTCSIIYTSTLHQINFLMGMCTLGRTSSNSYNSSTPKSVF